MNTCASPKMTSALTKRFPKMAYNNLGTTGLKVSAAGFGTYRVHISIDGHRKALHHALENGINLIDTSSNYADGGSEELIGDVINEMIFTGILSREELVIVSKAGYLQGQNYQLSQQLMQEGKPFPDLVEYSNGLEHCIHPEFLEDQLTRSLKRLQTKCADIYLLHNPEYYLVWAHRQGMALEAAQDEFYRRIEQAFMHLEIEAGNGRIQFYGISSNTIPVSQRRYDFVSTEKLLEIAESISENHHFKVIQCPMNLLETGAATEKNLSSGKVVLDYAKTKNLGILINRPLNAFDGVSMSRLVSLEIAGTFDQKKLTKNFDHIFQLEKDFIDNILPKLQSDEDTLKGLSGYFASGTYLAKHWQTLGSYWQWIESHARFLADQVSYAVQQVNEAQEKPKEVIKWLDEYVNTFNDLLGDLTLYYGQNSASINNDIRDKVKSLLNISTEINLQSLAIRTLRATDGISSILVGMRRLEYVDDILLEMQTSTGNTKKLLNWDALAQSVSDKE